MINAQIISGRGVSNSPGTGRSMVRDSSGNWYVLTIQRTNDPGYSARIYRSINNGQTWSVWYTLWSDSNYGFGSYDMVITANDTIYVVWAHSYTDSPNNQQIRIAKSTDGFVSITNVTSYSAAGENGSTPCLTVNSGNTVYLAWHHKTTTGDDHIYLADSSDNFVAQTTVETISNLSGPVDICFNPTNSAIHIAWWVSNNTFKERNSSAGWGSTSYINIDNSTGTAQLSDFSMAIDSGGVRHYSYNVLREGGDTYYRLCYAKSSLIDGGGFKQHFLTADTGHATYASIYQGSAELDTFIAYQWTADNEIYYLQKTSGVGFAASVMLTDNDSDLKQSVDWLWSYYHKNTTKKRITYRNETDETVWWAGEIDDKDLTDTSSLLVDSDTKTIGRSNTSNPLLSDSFSRIVTFIRAIESPLATLISALSGIGIVKNIVSSLSTSDSVSSQFMNLPLLRPTIKKISSARTILKSSLRKPLMRLTSRKPFNR